MYKYFLSCVSCEYSNASQASPPLHDSNSEIPPNEPPIRRTNLMKSSSWSGSRPLEEKFPVPIRHHSFPSTAAIGRRLNKVVLMPTTDSGLRFKTGQSLADRRMESLKQNINCRIQKELSNGPKYEDSPWLSLICGNQLLENEDIEGAIKEAKGFPTQSKNSISRLIRFVHDSAPTLFTMLVFTNKLKLLQQFCEKDIGDAKFPVQLGLDYKSIETTKCDPTIKLDFGSQIEVIDAMILFGHMQWLFFRPELNWTTFQHSPFSSSYKLPFLKRHEISRTDFSIVYECVIHRDYINFDSDSIDIAINKDGHPYAAVKQLLHSGLKKDDFRTFVKAEYQTLDILRGFENEHLIKATAFYKQKTGEAEDYCFVFPWAEHGNLRKFWKEKLPSIYDNNYMKWVFDQLEGLASAIHTLHHENAQSCRHGDLKPENVLCFNKWNSPNPPNPPNVKDHTSCVFVISDVGLARIHDRSTHLRSRTKMATGETIAYAAPETEIFPERATSRRYDIWSLGCLYLEFIIWLLYGIEELERFGEEIGMRFYTITGSAASLKVDGMKAAQINPVVKTWIEHIKKDWRCARTGLEDTAISRLIALIEERLLVVTANPDPKDPTPQSLEQKDDNEATAASGEHILPFRMRVREPTALNDEARAPLFSRKKRFENAGKDERAYSKEVYRGVSAIIKDVEAGVIQWINFNKDGLEAMSEHGPDAVTEHKNSTRRDSAGKNQEFLDDKWEYIPDDGAAQRLRADLKQVPQICKTSDLCGRCSNLSLWSAQCSFDDTAAKLNKSSAQCALCRLLSRSLQNWVTLPDDNLHFFRFGSSLKFNNKRLPPIASLSTLPNSEAPDISNLNIQIGFPELPHPGSTIHIKVLREWVRDCNTHQCLRSQGEPFLPTRLLDVGEYGLRLPSLICDTTRLNKKDKYLALSHRWGSRPKPGEPDPLVDKFVCTYEKNIHTLEHGIDDSRFPPMYQDAITIARELNVKYLWIDSLCIIQHDKNDPFDEDKGKDWEKESELMEQVFQSAYLTIAASCASSPAERFLRRRPERQCVTLRTGSTFYYLCDAIDDFDGDVEQGELNKRGWVLQERALSPRTIYFTEKQTYWECGEGVRCETLTKSKNSKASFLGDANFPYSFPTYVKGKKIMLYQDLYERYSKLALSYPMDRPVAIRGLEKRLMSALDTDGRYGVFDIYLRRGLLWQRDQPNLERIDFGDKNKSQVTVPSWSWMAYTGSIRYMNVPLGGVDWSPWEHDVISPWSQVKGGDQVSFELKVIVRGIKTVEPGARVFLDQPHSTLDRPFKCVVVGSSQTSNQVRGQTYYALIVTSVDSEDVNVYERAGVAFLNKHQIVWNNPGTEAVIR